MSYALYVGRNLTEDGVSYLAGYGDEPSGHWLEIVPRQTHQAGELISVGVTADALMPGMLSSIPQISETARHLRVSYSHYLGVPAPLMNGGLNEYGVAVRDVWSPSRPELVRMTAANQRGPNYSDLARLVLERAHTARQGVDLITSLIAAHGYSCYGGNSHIIADSEEAWIIIEFSGGLGLWVAERLGPDSIRACRPGHIGRIPLAPSSDFLFPAHFVETAVKLGWHRPEDDVFDVNAVYGDGKGPGAGAAWVEAEMRSRSAKKLSRNDLFWAISNSTLTGDTAGYGQVVPLLGNDADAIRHIFHSPVGPVTAPLLPVFLDQHDIPHEFGAHRYLMEGESSRFMDARHGNDVLSHVSQGQETSRSAVQIYKRLMHLAFQDQEGCLKTAGDLCRRLESQCADELAWVLDAAVILRRAGRIDLTQAMLAEFSNTRLLLGLEMAEKLSSAFELQLKLRGQPNLSKTPQSPPQIW